jgi:hypothetical protein
LPLSPLAPLLPIFALATLAESAEIGRMNLFVSRRLFMTTAGTVTELMLDRLGAVAYIRDQFGIPVEASDLEAAAKTTNGPPFRKWGRKPLYRRADLRAWALAKLSAPCRSTQQRA